jgi:hypothetical protein
MKHSKNFLKVLTLICFTFFMNSCTKESSEVITENFVNTSLEHVCTETRTSFKGCFELVFPVTIVFPDESTKEVNSFEDMKQAFREWKSANPEIKGRPNLQFPYSVTKEDGTIVTVDSRETLKTLVAECKINGEGHSGGGKDHFRPCFNLVYPITVNTPNGQVEVASKEAMKELLKSLKGKDKKLEFVFPITVTLKDGTTQVVNSREELRAIKVACKG